MRADAPEFAAINEAGSKSPRFVVRIGYDVDSLAVTSHDDVADVTAGTVLLGMLAEPTVTTQRLKPDEAVAEIGSASFALIDAESEFTTEVRERLLDGEGLRGKRVEFFVGYQGLDFDQYQLIATQTVSQATFNNGRYVVSCLDIQRSLRTEVFEPVATTLAAAIGATDATITLTSTSGLQLIQHNAAYSDAPGALVGYVKIKTEIIRYTGIAGNQITGCTRGVFNTVAAGYAVDLAAPSERREKVTEYIYLELPGAMLAYAVLTGKLYGTADTLPANWHLGIDEDLVRVGDFTGIGADLWNPADPSAGFPLRFEGLGRTDGKRFLEKEVYLPQGLFSPVYSDGTLGLRRMIRLREDAAIAITLDESNVVGYSDLDHDMRALHNAFVVNWSWNGTEFRRTTSFLDADSAVKHGAAETLTLNFKGLHGAKHTDGVIYSMLDMLRDRYAGPPLRIGVDVLPSLNRIEVGDIVRLRLQNVRDFAAGEAGSLSLDRAFEVQNVSADFRGAVALDLFGSTSDPSVESPTAAATALPDAFYSAIGTQLSTVPGVVIGSNIMTAAPVGAITGNAALTNAGAVFYHLGDLTIAAGVDLKIAANVQLRVRGFLTVNGSINGKAGGLAGVADGGGALYVSIPTLGIIFGNYYETIPGNPGYVGTTRGFDGVLAVRSFPLTATNYYNSRPAAIAVSKYGVAPRLMLKVSGTALQGLPDDLRGGGGPPGGRVGIYSDSAGLSAPSELAGGTGGNGGAGLAIICRGMGFGVNGYIDLSGADTASPAGYVDPTKAFTIHPGAGGPGGPGTMVVLLDGGALSVPDVGGGKFRAKVGAATITGTPLPREEFNFYNHPESGTTDGVATPASGFVTSDFLSINAQDMSGAALLIQHIPAPETVTADADTVVPPITALTTEAAEQGINVAISLPVAPIDSVELYMSTTNDRTNATKIFDGLASLIRVRVPDGATRYFWARDVLGGRRSEWYPVSSVAGVSGTAVGGLICRGNCEAYNNGVRKNGGAVAWDSDAYSPESYATGMFASFQSAQTNAYVMVGLNSDPDTDSTWTGLDYAWYIRADGILQIFESSVSRGTFGAYTTSTRLEIRYDGQRLTYYKDSVAQRVVQAAGLTLFLDSAFNSPGAAIKNLKYGPIGTAEIVPWIARGNCYAEVNAFGKSGGSAAYDSDVYSERIFPDGCMLTFQAADPTHTFVIGLNTDPTTDQNYTSIDYAWGLGDTATCQIFESGSLISSHGSYTAATVFSIRYDGQQVQYIKDGATVRTVGLRGALFFLDSSFYTPGGLAKNVQFGPLTTAAAIPFITVGGAVASANTIRKYAGAASTYDAGAYSSQAFDACSATAQIGSGNTGTTQGYFGLNSDPLTDLLESSLDYGWKFGGTNLSTMVNGTGTIVQVGYATTDVCLIKYDGEVVRWYLNGVEVRALADPGKKFFFDSALFNAGVYLWNVEFKPLGTAAAVPFTVSGSCVATSSSIRKVGGAAAWDSQAYSVQSFEQGCQLTFQVPSTTGTSAVLGLNTDPTTDASYTSVDYGFHVNSSGMYEIFQSGVSASTPAAYTAGSVFVIRYDGQQVQYLVNGAIVKTVPEIRQKTFFFDSSFYLVGSEIRNVAFAPLTTAATVPWIARGTVVATANTARKIGGTALWDSDSYSAQGYRGGCVLALNPEPAGTAPSYTMAGLDDNPAASTDYSTLEHAWFIHSASGLQIYESGVMVLDLGSSQWTTATALAIVYDGVTVRYLRDGALIREKYNPGKTFYGRVALRDPGQAVRALFFGALGQATPVQFIARTTTVVVSDNTAMKVSGSNAWDADVVSIVGYPKAYCQFKAGQLTHEMMVGLNSDPYTDSSYTSIDAAWYINSAADLFIYESGTLVVTVPGTYTTSTLLAISYDGTSARYYKDGELIRTQAMTMATAFFDSSFYRVGGILKDIKFGPGTVFPLVDTPDIGANAVTEISVATDTTETETIEDYVGVGASDYESLIAVFVPAKTFSYLAIITATLDAWQTGSTDIRMAIGVGTTTVVPENDVSMSQWQPVKATASPGDRVTVQHSQAVVAGVARSFSLFAYNTGAGVSTFNGRNITIRVELIKK